MKRKITMQEVAKSAGVSIATVSNVLNGIDKTSELTKVKVLNTVRELGYEIDYTARTLSLKKSNLIGLLLPVIQIDGIVATQLRNNPFYCEFMCGFEHSTTDRGYDILITGVSKGQRCKDWINKRTLDGIVVLGVYPETVFEELKNFDVPVVLIDTYEEYARQFHTINIDDELGGYVATKHLLQLGHRRIAIATSDMYFKGAMHMRFNGYKRALKEYGLEVDNRYIYESEISFHNGYGTAYKILSDNQDITAVFAVADLLAVGMIKGFEQLGKSVPNDISIVGFDDLNVCEYVTPRLTSIKQNVFKRGMYAADLIIGLIENEQRLSRNIILPIELVERESVKAIYTD